MSTMLSLATGRDALLRLALKLDAVVTAVNGAAYLLLAGPLSDLLGLPSALLRAEGAFLVPFAGAVMLLATRPAIPALAVEAVVLVNVAWTVQSVVGVAADWGSPSTAGAVWLVLQALVVAGFAAAQYAGLRRAS